MHTHQVRSHAPTLHASIDACNVARTGGSRQTNAASPVIARPTMSVFTSRVPSYE